MPRGRKWIHPGIVFTCIAGVRSGKNSLFYCWDRGHPNLAVWAGLAIKAEKSNSCLWGRTVQQFHSNRDVHNDGVVHSCHKDNSTQPVEVQVRAIDYREEEEAEAMTSYEGTKPRRVVHLTWLIFLLDATKCPVNLFSDQPDLIRCQRELDKSLNGSTKGDSIHEDAALNREPCWVPVTAREIDMIESYGIQATSYGVL